MMALRGWLAIASVAVLANGNPVQLANLQLPPSAAVSRQAVVDLFNESYTAYKTYAWGHDGLRPITESGVDDLNGWGATIIDAMSTMCLMGFHDWFDEAANYVKTVDFSVSKTDDVVSLLEATVRDVGGLLSAYEIAGKSEKHDVLVRKAEQVAQQMEYAFIEGNAIPYGLINFADHMPVKEPSSIAGAGSLTLEWNRLSLYTGVDTYRQLAEGSVQHMIKMQGVFPGMPAQYIDPSTGESVGSYVSWGAESDSYYEYLIKYARLTNTDDPSYTSAWLTAVDSSIKFLLKTSTMGNWTYLADYNGQVIHLGSHLACFYGGNWILGGKLTGNDTIVDIGLRLTDACWNTYASTATGIGPETFTYISDDGDFNGGFVPTQDQIDFYNEHGYFIGTPDYYMRPEVIESNFYAWRATGDQKYLDNAASVVQSFQKYLSAGAAFAGIRDVNNVTSTKVDYMPSFWFAEVLKYLFLTFDDPNRISLDHYVFNTEGHPFEAPPAKEVYGPHLHISVM